jgi:hypothetical protein
VRDLGTPTMTRSMSIRSAIREVGVAKLPQTDVHFKSNPFWVGGFTFWIEQGE